MTTASNPTYVCPNGHGSPPFASARFCNQCGATFVPAPQPTLQTPAPWQGGGQTAAYQTPTMPPVNGAPYPAPPVVGAAGTVPAICQTCGGDGSRLTFDVIVCPQCRWLRPLVPGYVVHTSAFQSGADSAAMAKLRSMGPLNTAARAVSDKVGRRWVETSFNAVRLGDNQLPEIYHQAIRAARLLGMPSMPDVYVSGDKMWDAATYGSDRSAFLLIGTALLNNYKGDDLLFMLAREMGHCRAGHALWKTVGMFLLGQQGPRKGMMSDGILKALDPQHLIESAMEVPFLTWARQAEITADRAGMLAIGSEETARRVLLSWSLRSVPLYQQINIDAWLQQQEDSDDQMTRIAEMVSSPMPFITRRLKLLRQFAESPELAQMRSVIGPLDQQAIATPTEHSAPAAASVPIGQPAADIPAAQPVTPADPAHEADFVRLSCPECHSAMRVPRADLSGKDVFKVRCPNTTCGKVLSMQKKPATAPVTDERTTNDE